MVSSVSPPASTCRTPLAGGPSRSIRLARPRSDLNAVPNVTLVRVPPPNPGNLVVVSHAHVPFAVAGKDEPETRAVLDGHHLAHFPSPVQLSVHVESIPSEQSVLPSVLWRDRLECG